VAWTIFVALSFVCGLAMLVYGLAADTAGWNHMNVGLQWLVVLLPIASVLTLAVLCGQRGLSWTAVVMLAVFLGATQTGLMMEFDTARVTMAFMPAALMIFCAAALASKMAWIARASPALAVLGLLAVGLAAVRHQ